MGLGEAYGRQFQRLVKESSSLGKICLVEPYRKTEDDNTTIKDRTANPHIDFTFMSVDTKYGHLDVAGNSGNMLSAVGPYAYNARLLPPEVYAIKDGDITIIIRNTNTMKLVESTFAVSGGQASVTGSHVVDGVNGRGSRITLAFQDTIGSSTGRTFPTGRTVDVVEGLKVTCVDGAVPVVFVRADAIGVPGTILPHDLTGHRDKVELLERIRRAAGVIMGIAQTEKTVPRTIPKLAIVSQSSQHHTVSGAILKAAQMDIVVRFITDCDAHQAIPLTGALTTAIAARMPGTIVEQLLAPEEVIPGIITLAHPSGRVQIKLDLDEEKEPPIWVASISTTAQRLFAGKAYWTDSSNEPKMNLVSTTNTARHTRGLAFVNELRLREKPEDLVKHFYKEGLDATARLPSSKQDYQQPMPSLAQRDLQLPSPTPTRDETHLIRELSALRTSLTHFTSLYPSPKSPRANPPSPTPSSISHHLAAITQHINVLASSLKHMPRPSRNITTDRKKGEQWRHWAKTFSRWDKIRLLREREKKMSRRQRKKSEWNRWRDSELNALSKRGRPVVMGNLRRKMLQSRELVFEEVAGEAAVGEETRLQTKGRVVEGYHDVRERRRATAKRFDGLRVAGDEEFVENGAGNSPKEAFDTAASSTYEAAADRKERPGSKQDVDTSNRGTEVLVKSQFARKSVGDARTFKWPSFKSADRQEKDEPNQQ